MYRTLELAIRSAIAVLTVLAATPAGADNKKQQSAPSRPAPAPRPVPQAVFRPAPQVAPRMPVPAAPAMAPRNFAYPHASAPPGFAAPHQPRPMPPHPSFAAPPPRYPPPPRYVPPPHNFAASRPPGLRSESPNSTAHRIPSKPTQGPRSPVPEHLAGQTQPPLSDGRRLTPLLRLDPHTTIASHADGGGLTLRRAIPRGNVVIEHGGHGHPGPVLAYFSRKDPATGAENRLYLDGRRMTIGHDFTLSAAPHRLSVLTHRDGLREVSLPDRRLMFREHFGLGPRGERLLMRTVQTAVIGGAVVTLVSPRVWTYAVVPFNGLLIHHYLPPVFEPAWYRPFLAPLPEPVVVGPECVFCPAPLVAFAEPIVAYANATDLVGDRVLVAAVQEQLALETVATAPIEPDPDMAALSEQVGVLEQQLASAAQANDQLRSELGDREFQVEDVSRQLAPQVRPVRTSTKMSVPEDIRRQVWREVQQCVSLHQENKPLALEDVVASEQAGKFVFQVGELIEAAAIGSGERCTLTGGDLVSFAEAPGHADTTAKVKVVAAKPGSCRVGTVVGAGLADLQEMLNGFTQRVETSLQEMHDHLGGAKAPQSRPGQSQIPSPMEARVDARSSIKRVSRDLEPALATKELGKIPQPLSPAPATPKNPEQSAPIMAAPTRVTETLPAPAEIKTSVDSTNPPKASPAEGAESAEPGPTTTAQPDPMTSRGSEVVPTKSNAAATQNPETGNQRVAEPGPIDKAASVVARPVDDRASKPPGSNEADSIPAAGQPSHPKAANPVQTAATNPAEMVRTQPALTGSVLGVIDAATLVMGERQVKLQGVDPGPVELLASFASWIQSRSPLTCQEEAATRGVYRCRTSNGVDLAEAAILNGLGRAAADANALYKQRESEAQQAHRGLWKSR